MRATRKKRAPFMNPKRWTALSLVLLLAVIAGLGMWYNTIFKGIWSAEAQAKQQAIEAAALSEVDSTEKYVWDETVWVVEGKTADGQELYVWLRDNGTETIPASNAVSKQQIRNSLLQTKPDADIKHIKPGIVEGQYVWEAFYSRSEGGQQKYEYDFYNFENGTFIKTLKLPAKQLTQ
ncbi:hypothetical protein PCCS19_55180 [Paenibacillus sp. CCS19]|uniref:cell wall elongation regulator TseB-like domain-containing protein n=1 Tax=Paenibacillus sp. CCS19 TaxID=3158387 RepID=UPI00256A16E3|nr:DUF5590 domain-containing protein [Paenibacillus cellulosilyticus]GMK42458.1 hypothetical protein PCCS19_55180 [Paenibacillus cellulosilyticus]